MRPTPEDLADLSKYVLLDQFAHENLVPTVKALLRHPGSVKTTYLLINVVIIGTIGLLWYSTNTPITPALPNLCGGMALGYVLLLPVHEWVHALTYRLLGARGVKVVYRWRSLTAYCVADRFVVTMREFLVVCLAPFLALITAMIVAIALVGGFRPVLWGMLWLHVGACSGDFAFVNYAWKHRGDHLLTYDDVANARSFFYALRPPRLRIG